MQVFFGQVYIAPEIAYHFSHHFQKLLSDRITSLVQSSDHFVELYGHDFKLVFNVSAKQGISECEIRGPATFRRTRDVEFTIYLPFDVTSASDHPNRLAIRYLLGGVVDVLSRLKVDSARVIQSAEALIDRISSDPVMFKVNGR